MITTSTIFDFRHGDAAVFGEYCFLEDAHKWRITIKKQVDHKRIVTTNPDESVSGYVDQFRSDIKTYYSTPAI